MIAHRRAEGGDLNARARGLLRDSGAIHGPELELPGGRFAAGDRVVIKRNDRRLDVQNEQRARVVVVDPSAGALTPGCGCRTVDLDRRFLHGVTEGGDPTLLHGYAITGHVAQGLTVDRACVLAGDSINREWSYVALSRGRLSNRLHAAILPDDPPRGVRARRAAATRPDPAAGRRARGQRGAGPRRRQQGSPNRRRLAASSTSRGGTAPRWRTAASAGFRAGTTRSGRPASASAPPRHGLWRPTAPSRSDRTRGGRRDRGRA
jgi:hypothetical protein